MGSEALKARAVEALALGAVSRSSWGVGGGGRRSVLSSATDLLYGCWQLSLPLGASVSPPTLCLCFLFQLHHVLGAGRGRVLLGADSVGEYRFLRLAAGLWQKPLAAQHRRCHSGGRVEGSPGPWEL